VFNNKQQLLYSSVRHDLATHGSMLYCIVYGHLYIVSHNMNQIEALFSAFQLHEKVRLVTRERQRKRKRKNRGSKRGWP